MAFLDFLNPISGVAGSIIGAIASGAEKAKDRKYKEKMQAQAEQKLKPKQSYYQTPYMQGLDRVLTQAIIGNMQERLGDRASKWGLDIDPIRQQMGLLPMAAGAANGGARLQSNVPGINTLKARYGDLNAPYSNPVR